MTPLSVIRICAVNISHRLVQSTETLGRGCKNATRVKVKSHMMTCFGIQDEHYSVFEQKSSAVIFPQRGQVVGEQRQAEREKDSCPRGLLIEKHPKNCTGPQFDLTSLSPLWSTITQSQKYIMNNDFEI